VPSGPEFGPDFEAVLAELSALTGWDRGRVLLGLGLSDPERPGEAERG
jgi:hypothetical protein